MQRRTPVLAYLAERSPVAIVAAVVATSMGLWVTPTIAQSAGATASQQGGAVGTLPTVTAVAVVSQRLDRPITLPGDLAAFQDVEIRPKLSGFLEEIAVDRGSLVKRGQVIARLVAPELAAQRSEAEARVQSAQSQRLEAEAKLAADEATYKRLKAAAETPGVVAGNDVDVAQKTVDADRARVELWKQNEQVARDAAQVVRETEAYLRIVAPFDGVVTERNVHPGSLVGPSAPPMLRIQQVSTLRLIVAVPEEAVAGTERGTLVQFTLPAFPGQTFTGRVARLGHALDVKTRTMPVELDVANPDRTLSPGMFAQVAWSVRRPTPSLFVPPSAIATTTERSFVVRIRDGATEWVDVKRGSAMKDLTEVFGNLRPGDLVAVRGTDEIRPGTKVQVRTGTTK